MSAFALTWHFIKQTKADHHTNNTDQPSQRLASLLIFDSSHIANHVFYNKSLRKKNKTLLKLSTRLLFETSTNLKSRPSDETFSQNFTVILKTLNSVYVWLKLSGVLQPYRLSIMLQKCTDPENEKLLKYVSFLIFDTQTDFKKDF